MVCVYGMCATVGCVSHAVLICMYGMTLGAQAAWLLCGHMAQLGGVQVVLSQSMHMVHCWDAQATQSQYACKKGVLVVQSQGVRAVLSWVA